MVKKTKKHTILGGIKVNSNQLSKWGKLGGRPKKYQNNAERARAFRLRKKQERLGEKAQLRSYNYCENLVKTKPSLEMICNKCHGEMIGGPQQLGTSCYRIFCEGKIRVRRRK